MGDRANVGFKMEGGNILYLYQHWGGYRHLQRLGHALDAAGPRHGDPGYGIRIVISHMIGDDWQSTSGHGIYLNELADNEYMIPVVDFYKGTVSLHSEGSENGINAIPEWTMSIDDFVKSELAKDMATSSL